MAATHIIEAQLQAARLQYQRQASVLAQTLHLRILFTVVIHEVIEQQQEEPYEECSRKVGCHVHKVKKAFYILQISLGHKWQ